jgi:hypothetical protein
MKQELVDKQLIKEFGNYAKKTFDSIWWSMGTIGRSYAIEFAGYENVLNNSYLSILYANSKTGEFELSLKDLDNSNETRKIVYGLKSVGFGIIREWANAITRSDKQYKLNYLRAYLQFLPHFVGERNVRKAYEKVKDIHGGLNAEKKKFDDRSSSIVRNIMIKKGKESIEKEKIEIKQLINRVSSLKEGSIEIAEKVLEEKLPELLAEINLELMNSYLMDEEKVGLIAVKEVALKTRDLYRNKISKLKGTKK